MMVKGADEEDEACFWLQSLERSKENPFLSQFADGKIQRMKQLQLLQNLGVEVDEVAQWEEYRDHQRQGDGELQCGMMLVQGK